MNTNPSGIIRRIDDLGRINIPKEIRRHFRIKETDPLEIIITEDGILLKKYSPMKTIQDFSEEITTSLFEATGHMIFVTDKERIISVNGVSKKGRIYELIDDEIATVISSRVERFTRDYDNQISRIIIPIIVENECVGVLIIASKDINLMGDLELKLARIASAFLGRMLEG